VISTDFITKLPPSKGYTAIMVITDPYTKTLIAEPCTDNIDANQTAEILIRRVVAIYGLPSKIVSD
jgi:hypothetical protein